METGEKRKEEETRGKTWNVNVWLSMGTTSTTTKSGAASDTQGENQGKESTSFTRAGTRALHPQYYRITNPN